MIVVRKLHPIREDGTQMNSKGKNRDVFETKEWSTLFLRPSLVAIVCLIIISLFVIAGFMNLRAVNRSLTDLTVNNGLAIIQKIKQVAENYYQQLTRIPHMTFNYENENLLREYGLGISDSFLFEIAELAREIDIGWGDVFFNDDDFHSFIQGEDLWVVAFLDERGRVTYQNRSIPDEVIHFVKPVIRRESDLKVNIFDRLENHGIGVLALRRKNVEGVVIVGLDENSFQDRCLTFAIKKAIYDMGQDASTAYFVLLNRGNNIEGITGELLQSRLSLLASVPLGNSTHEEVARRKIHLEEKNLLEIAVPLTIQDQYAGIMGLGLRMESTERIIRKNRNIVILSSGFLIVIASLSIWFLYINQSHYIVRMQVMERRMNQAERLSALGRLAAGVAHEIRNPLNAISMAVQRLQRDNPHRLTVVIRDEIMRLNQIIEDFLGFSRSRKLVFKEGDLQELIENILLLKKEEMAFKGINLETFWHDTRLSFPMDQEKMKQAFLNIINNAMESINAKGSIIVSSRKEDKGKVCIEIKDTGGGLSPEDIKHIFEPDYTTKDKGLGLGLPIAHEIIMGHGGEMRVESKKNIGTVFEILLPVQ